MTYSSTYPHKTMQLTRGSKIAMSTYSRPRDIDGKTAIATSQTSGSYFNDNT
ncbi:hypothetical protein [Gimesia maris]|uniref:hypothetical protein n=1 Tax=Gimesia maris TaxID=122 RepID=UPI003A8D3750